MIKIESSNDILLELNEKTSLVLIKLLEYVPESLNIDKILEKDVSTLTINEIEILRQLKRDTSVALAIKNQVDGKEYDKALYAEAVGIDLKQLIGDKFNHTLIEKECSKYLSKYETYDKCIDILEKKNRTAFEEAVLFELEDYRFTEELEELNSTLDEEIDRISYLAQIPIKELHRVYGK